MAFWDVFFGNKAAPAAPSTTRPWMPEALLRTKLPNYTVVTLRRYGDNFITSVARGGFVEGDEILTSSEGEARKAHQRMVELYRYE